MPLPGISVHPLVPTPPETGVLLGLLFAWGQSTEGHLGDGQTATNFSSPIAIGAQSWRSISCGGGNAIGDGHGHTVAIRSDFLLFAWGDGGFGQLGDNTATDRSSPVQIGSSSWLMCAAGSDHSFGIRIDGLLFAWGGNSGGGLGDGSVTQRNSPVQIGTSSWRFIAAGQNTGFGIDITGRLFSWGFNNTGALGDAGANRSSPLQIGTSSWTMVHAGRAIARVAAIRVDGLLFTWGDGTQGAIGDGTASGNRSSPVQIGSSSWVHCIAGGTAVRIDGQLFGWGATSGAGVQSSPTQIGVALTWKTVWGHPTTKFAIASDNTLWGWGGGTLGQLGNSAILSVTSPVQIGTSQWKQVDTGVNNAVPTAFTAGLKFV